MSQSFKTRDVNPLLRQAGITQFKKDEHAGLCIQPQQSGSETPPHIKKYRKSYKQQHGTTILHYGIVDDELPKKTNFGISTKPTDFASKCFVDKNQQGINQFINDIQEQKYASSQREPLGQRMNYGYKPPQKTEDPGFKFGLQTEQNAFNGKQTIFPQDYVPEQKEVQQQYVKTHGNFEAGEQKDRQYKWNIDPSDYRFGKTVEPVHNEMKQILNPESRKEQFAKTKILQKKQEDHKDYQSDPLGKSKNLAQINPNITHDTVFGIRKNVGEDWDAGKCLKGQPIVKETQPDSNLGHTTKFGFRNEVKQGDENRLFGTPTIRNDIKAPSFKSVADPYNYGDEKPAVELLFPQKFDWLGVNEQDFLLKRSKKEIRDIFSSIGHSFDDQTFNNLYQQTLELENSQNESTTVKGFMHVMIASKSQN